MVKQIALSWHFGRVYAVIYGVLYRSETRTWVRVGHSVYLRDLCLTLSSDSNSHLFLTMPSSHISIASFKGDIVTPSNPDYEKAISRWAKNATRRASIIAFVKDDQDVALAINHAVTENMPIAIRGGGHNVAGASSTDGGLVIDLSRYLNGVRIDPENRLAYVGGGAIWETVDKAAIEHGLATVGGTVNHVSDFCSYGSNPSY